MNEQQPNERIEPFGVNDPKDENLIMDGQTKYPRVYSDSDGATIHWNKYLSCHITQEQTNRLLYELITKTNPPAILQRPNLKDVVFGLGLAVGVAIGVGFMALVIIVMVKFV